MVQVADADGSGSVNASSVNTLTGAAADLNSAYASAGISNLGNEAVTLSDGDIIYVHSADNGGRLAFPMTAALERPPAPAPAPEPPPPAAAPAPAARPVSPPPAAPAEYELRGAPPRSFQSPTRADIDSNIYMDWRRGPLHVNNGL